MSTTDTTLLTYEIINITPLNIILGVVCIFTTTIIYDKLYYKFCYYTHPSVLNNAYMKTGLEKWADDDFVPISELKKRMVWFNNKLVTYEDAGYLFDRFGLPINPYKRTGKYGRGMMGKYGANHAADPIVTRFHNGRYQMITVIRSDSGLPAIPGGMVDAGESYTMTLGREITEEAAEENSLLINKLKNGRIVYSGYADDPRCTNTAWIETVAVHVHLNEYESDMLVLRPAKDGETLKSFWYDITIHNMKVNPLYGSHGDLVMKAMDSFDNNWRKY